METSLVLSRDRVVAWIVIVALAGLIVRIIGATGALWLDEAQSAIFAVESGSIPGVFKTISHDNNHHLNSVWLLFVGLDAPPLVARALSILCGSAAIMVAGLIGLRRSPLAGLVTAALFAFSPALVTLGSEARGYAGMTLMALIAILYVDRWLEGDGKADRPLVIAACFYVGILFQLTMLAFICAIVGWASLTRCHRDRMRAALPKLVGIFAVPLIAAVAATLLAFAPTVSGSSALRFGTYHPFTWPQFIQAVVSLIGYTVGVTWEVIWLPLAAVILVILARNLETSRLPLYWLAIIAFPLSLAALQVMNIGHPRYFLLAGIALLLLLGEALAALLRAGGWKRLLASAGLSFFVSSSAVASFDLYAAGRGDPAEAIRAMAARAPQGAELLINRGTGIPIIRVAAEEQGYRLRYTTSCPAQRFLFVDRFHVEPMPESQVTQCGVRYAAIASAHARGMSGQNWTLYERMR